MEIADPFPASDFDQWADSYDRDVLDEGRFPFIGYQRALEAVVSLAGVQPGMSVLDLGAGTGNLAASFDRLGCRVWGTDFSEAMLLQARRKLPHIPFFLADLRKDLPAELPGSFDRIVSAYVFHHFDLFQKVQLVKNLAGRLKPLGRMVIADIAFSDQRALQQVKQAVGQDWDEEFYWLSSEVIPAFEEAGLAASFTPVSNMAGVFTIQPT
jgi:putative AdoMet-dependent methyltransferase